MRAFVLWRQLLFCLLILLCQPSFGQWKAELLPQKHFPKTIPAGQYSGVAWLGGNRYAVVSDKSDEDGFYVFSIDINAQTGAILAARNNGFRGSGHPGRDNEDIVYDSLRHILFMTGEKEGGIKSYNLDGELLSDTIVLPDFYHHLPPNLGLEALSYDAVAKRLWTCNEASPIVVTAFSADSLRALLSFPYALDTPRGQAQRALYYAHGVGALCALPTGELLVLERELYVPRFRLGAWVACKLFVVHPSEKADERGYKPKYLLTSWRTRLNFFRRSFANYEGMCLGPRLSDGSFLLILVADSQGHYGGVLRDWIRSIRFTPLSQGTDKR